MTSKQTVPGPALPDATPGRLQKEPGPFTTSTYWFALAVSLVSLIVIWLFYGSLWWIQLLYWVAAGIAIGLTAWSVGGLLAAHNVIQRVTAQAAARREARDRRDQSQQEEEVVYRENVVVRLVKFVWHLVTLVFLLAWNIVLRTLFIIEITVVQTIILGYDVFYYVTYAAWVVGARALQWALAIALWALRVSWKILRVLTYLPIARGLWRNRMRPAIMGRWNKRMELLAHQRATRRDQKRRLVALRGKDPDKWERDQKLRYHYPFPHPHEARRGLRAWIEDRQRVDYNRRDRWRAYRKGLPMPPKVMSARRRRREEERKTRMAERQGKSDKGKERKAKRARD